MNLKKSSLIGLLLAQMLLSACGNRAILTECPRPVYPLPEKVAQCLSSFKPGTKEDKWVVDFAIQQEILDHK